MLKKCIYNSHYIAHYAQVEPIIVKRYMRHNETQLATVWPFQFCHVLGFKSEYQLNDQPFTSP